MDENIDHIDYPLVAEGHSSMYVMHKYWARKPHNVVSHYIEHYSEEDEIVLDPFVGSGVTAIEAIKLNRKGIGLDLDPIATFITQQTATPAELNTLQETFENIQERLKEQIQYLYDTQCTQCSKKAEIIVSVWGRDESYPTNIRYYCQSCNKRLSKTPDSNDVELLDRVAQTEIPYWYPTTTLTYNGREFKKGEGNSRVDKLYTKRNLIALSILMNEITCIEDKKLKNLFKFAFTSMVHLASSMCPDRPSRPYSSFWPVQSYWVPPKYLESNVLRLFKSAVTGRQGLLKAKEDTNEQIAALQEGKEFNDLHGDTNALFKTHNALELSELIPHNSVDYVFTDPPYGGAVQYYELSTLWNAWLRFDEDWWEDEITINDAQHKDFDYYHKMLYSAFLEIKRVLKPERWMTVTFHSTDIKVYNSIIKACIFAGFDLEKIVYQPPARASAKGLLQPYGSAVGDYYIRFRKPQQERQKVQAAEADNSRFETVVVQSAKKIIAERGEPTAYTHILNGIYPELDRYGVLLSATRDIKEVLQEHIGNEFQLVDVTDQDGNVVGQKWWLQDPYKEKINYIPLHERVEKAIINVLNSNIVTTFDEIQQAIFMNFPNALTPEKHDIRAVLEEYAEHAGNGRWRLRPQVRAREDEHSRIISVLADLGAKAGYDVWIGSRERGETYQGERLAEKSISDLHLPDSVSEETAARIKNVDVLWIYDDEIVAAFEVENSTTITEAVVRTANIPDHEGIRKVIVIPEERENLLVKKLQEPGLQELGIEDWYFIFYDALSDYYDNKKNSRSIDPDDIFQLARSPRKREVKQQSLNLFSEGE